MTEHLPALGVTPIINIDEGVIGTLQPKDGWKTLARKLSSLLPGQVWSRESGVTWLCGRHREYLIDLNSYEAVLNAQYCMKELGLPISWHIGGMSRTLLEWIDAPQKTSGNCRQLLEGRIGYYDCSPGHYPFGILYDVEAAYYMLFSRLPSLRVAYQEEKKVLEWLPMTDDSRSRFKDVVQSVASSKVLRNSLVGASLGSLHPHPVYIRGEKKSINLGRGSNFAAASVIIRSMWELTLLTSWQTEAICSCVDSVITTKVNLSSHWVKLGLKQNVKAFGMVDLFRPGVYKVGTVYTIPYNEGDTKTLFLPRQYPPDNPIHKWLEAA